MFSMIFPSLFSIVFILIFGFVIFNMILSIKENMHNNRQPKIPVEALVVTKRAHTSTNNTGNNTFTDSTNYYVTFEFSNKERLEFNVSGAEYGLISERDFGILTFQGSRFISFERK